MHWVLRTGAPWQDIPDRYPSPATCHRRFQQWVRTGVLLKIPLAIGENLEAQHGNDERPFRSCLTTEYHETQRR
jgi:transposase